MPEKRKSPIFGQNRHWAILKDRRDGKGVQFSIGGCLRSEKDWSDLREYIERAYENDPGIPMITVEIYNAGYKPPGILKRLLS